jgi:Flp pilus assembly protein TadG
MLIRIRRQRNLGQAIVVMALAMVAICGMLAIAIDAGRLFFERRLMQDAVDAGALAGAQDLVGTNANPNGVPASALYHAVDDALSTFNLDPTHPQGDPFYVNPPGNKVTDVVGGYTIQAIAPTGYNQKQVQVTALFNATGTFAQVIGFKNIQIVATATAEAGTNPKTYAIFAYTKGGSGNTIYNDQNGIAQIDDGQDGTDVCDTSASGLTLSNAKFHVPNPTQASLNVNGHVTLYQGSDNHSLFQYWTAPTPFGTGQDPEPDYIVPDTSQIATAPNRVKQSNVLPGGSVVVNGVTLYNHTSQTRDIVVFFPGKYSSTNLNFPPGLGDNVNTLYIFFNGIYYLNGADFHTTGGYMANTSDALPHYSNTAPSYGVTDLPPAADGTDGVEFVLNGDSDYVADNSAMPNDGSVFFVAPSFVPTGSTHIAFYIAATNNNTGNVWKEAFNASASNQPIYQIWGTVFDADGSGEMSLTGVELGPHDPQPNLHGPGAQYAINGEFIGAFLNLYGGNVLGNAQGTSTSCPSPGYSGLIPGNPALLVQYNWRFAPAPGVNSYLVK